MSQITDFIKTELYPTLFNYIDTAFPEHNFKQYSKGWRSNTYLNGTLHQREDKTTITKKRPGFILEQGGEVKSLIDYVIDRDKVDFIQAVELLANKCGLSIPKNNDFNQEEYKKRKEREELLEVVNDYFIFCLGKANGKPQRLYLDMRGYSEDIIENMELGKAPEPDKIKGYLETIKQYPKEAVDEFIKSLPKGVGTSHALTIPYRVGGQIKGFKFRAIDEAIKPKYLNSIGLDKIGGFFNIPGTNEGKDLIITEGELDSLHASAKGVKSIVSTGGSSVNPEQIKDAIKRGYKSFTICFDTEPGKEEETKKKVNRVIEVILGEGVNSIYIATLPQVQQHPTKVDVDSFIRDKGVEEFKAVIYRAIPYFEYKLNNIIEKYGNLETEQGELYPRDIDNLQEEVIETGATIENPLDKDRYKKLFTDFEPVKALGVTEESLSITLDRLTSSKEREEQSKDLNRLLAEVKTHQDKGETSKVLELLESRVKDIKIKDKATEFSSLLLPNTEAEIKDRLGNKPESLTTSYRIDTEDLLLPSGALSFLCAPTSHGKTTLLLNLIIDVVKKNPDKNFYFFSYEEDRDAITTSALNIYQGEELSKNSRKSINSYFSTGSEEYITYTERAKFRVNKEQFFKELIETNRLNIQYSNYNSDTLIEAIRYLAKNTNAGGVFIDYIQLLNLPQGKYKTYSRQEEIKEICIALKDVAVETGLPIILGAQFNREVVNHMRIHPTKIGEAGDIERIANLILGFWNNNFKPSGTDGEINEIQVKDHYKPDTIYATILKNRGGRVGAEDLLTFNGNTGNISNQSNSSNFKF